MVRAEPPHPSTVGPRPVRRGRRPALSRRAVAAAALRIGFEDLTLVAVAAELGVSHAALYTHVQDRADLAAAAIDLLVDETVWPAPGGPWRPYLEAQAETLWGLLAADPALVRAASATPTPPRTVDHFDVVARSLMDDGFAPEDALLAVDLVFDLVHDVFARGQELASARTADAGGAGDEPGAPAWIDRLDPRLRPLTLEAVSAPHEWFLRKLRVVLDGIEAARAPAADADADAAGPGAAARPADRAGPDGPRTNRT